MAENKKMNVGPALTVPLALACKAARLTTGQFQKFGVADKCATLKQHPVAVKVMDRIQVSAEMLWVVLGFILLLHGAQFKHLFLCVQVITTFCLERVKESAFSIHSDVMKVHEKMMADAPETLSADAKAEAKPESNKHAQKRNSKKEDNTVVDPAELKRQQQEDADVTKKMLKALDSDKVARTAFDLFTSFLACHMVMRNSSMQTLVIVHALVKSVKKHVVELFEFAGHEDMLAWMDLFVSLFLYVVVGLLGVMIAPLAFAMNVAVIGAQLVTEHGLKVAEAMGRIESAESFSGSVKGLGLLGGLTAFGTMWQLWALMANSGMAWYFQILYLPGVMAEFFVALL